MNAQETALNLHQNSFVLDTHCDTLKCLTPMFTRARDSMWIDRSHVGLGYRSKVGHIDIPRLQDGGVNCQVFAISSSRERTPPFALRTAMDQLDVFFAECERNQSQFTHVTTSQEIDNAVNTGKIAALLSIEGADIIEGNLSILRIFYRLGVRMVGLVHSLRNLLADGVTDHRTGGGLSELGVTVVEELDQLGIIIDISHLNDAGFWDLLDVSKRPLIASHSNCRAICDHPRNLTDEQIQALADRDGVIGLNFSPSFIHPNHATVERVINHLDHIVELVGPDHVGLGSDFDGIQNTPEGLDDVSKLPNITQELINRDYSEDTIRKILGGNHLRIIKNVID